MKAKTNTKSVLISIRPEWCEKIRSGEKKTELRRSKPTLPTPFKCYIYCTKPKIGSDSFWIIRKKEDGVNEDRFYGNGIVIKDKLPYYRVGVYVPDQFNGIRCIKRAKRQDRHYPLAVLLLMMFRSANQDRMKGETIC